MKQERIIELAYGSALNIWALQNKRLESNPENEIAKVKANKAWEELKEIEKMILEVE